MAMTVIVGTFRIVGAQPDGDSVRFYPNNPEDWELVGGVHKVRRNAKGGAQLRLDGIDTLETHYPIKGGIVHQPFKLGRRAAKQLVDWLGFSDVVRDPDETVTAATPDATPGYILTRGADLYGRCVALVGRGDAPGSSGDDIFVNVQLLRRTANYRLLRSGLAYPTYYRKLFPDLREAMTRAVASAREKKELWQVDETQTGAKVLDMQSLFDDLVILPKLFRRLVDYLRLNDGDPSLAAFEPYLEQRDDRIFILSTGHSTGFGTVVSVNGQTVKLTRPPEDLVFEER
jgi:endonuclease YncB( thermonuclease family)